jgi:hypothetical protein
MLRGLLRGILFKETIRPLNQKGAFVYLDTKKIEENVAR